MLCELYVNEAVKKTFLEKENKFVKLIQQISRSIKLQ